MSADKRKELVRKYLRQQKDIGRTQYWTARSGSSAVQADGDSMEEVKKQVQNCRKCRLGSQRLNPCFGNGSSSADIMFIGEGPGYDEDHTGNVFVGRAGKLLDRILESMLDLTRDEVYITNIVKCHPMKIPSNPDARGNDRPPNPDEVETCMPYLSRQVEIVIPSVIVTLGSPATKTILRTEKGITGLRGKLFEQEMGKMKVRVVPTFHPAYLLRNSSKKKEVFEDFKFIRSLL